MKQSKVLAVGIALVASFFYTFIAFAASPSATNLSAAETYTEDTTLNLIDIVASDTDGGSITATLTLSSTLVGSLTTATSGAVTSTFSSGVWSASGSIADVNTLLASVSFVPTTNGNSSFTIATNVSDGSTSVSGTKTVTGVAVNDAPSATNLSAAETYTEDTTLNLTDIVITDVDSSTVVATLTLSNSSAGTLSTATSGATTSTFSSGVWSATGSASDVNTLLSSVSFTPAANFNSNFTIATSVSDGALSATGSKTFLGVAVNDAPTLDSSKSPALSSVVQNAAAPTGAVGTLVSSLVDGSVPVGQVDNVSDSDTAALYGIAITSVDSVSLTCYFTINGGATWSVIGAVSTSAARLLSADSDNRIYCQPTTGFTGTVASALTFRAWDQTSGTDGGTASTATSGGTSAFSTATDTVSLVVTSTPTNSAPVAVDDSYTLAQDFGLVMLDVINNDTDVDTDTLHLVSATAASHGTVSVVGDQVSYFSDLGYCGADSFSYTVADPSEETDSGDVTLDIVCAGFTEAPVLLSPTTASVFGYKGSFVAATLSYMLPEPMTSGTLQVTFTPAVGSPVTLVLDDVSDGDVATTKNLVIPIDGGITSTPGITSATADSLPFGVYTVELSYVDKDGNPAATATATDVVIAGLPEIPTNLGPVELTANGSTTNNSQPTFTFTITNTNPDSQVGYIFILSDGLPMNDHKVVDFQSVLVNQGPQSFTVGQAGGGMYGVGSSGQELPAGTYYWNVSTYSPESVITIPAYAWDSLDTEAYAFRLGVSTTNQTGGSGGIVAPLPAVSSLGASPAIPKNVESKNPPFLKNLRQGIDDPDVARLQQYLNTHGFPVAKIGWGSPGQEVTVFGIKTRKALAAFQKSVGLPATGYFGPMTREYVNAH